MLVVATIKRFVEVSQKETNTAVLSDTISKDGFATFKTTGKVHKKAD